MKTLSQYKFGVKGFLALFLGAIIPSVFVSTLVMVIDYVFGISFTGSYTFMLISNTVMWLGAILSFNYFSCYRETNQHLKFDFSLKDFSTYLLIFPMTFGVMLIGEFLVSLIPVTGPFFGVLYEKYSNILSMMSDNFIVLFIMAVVMAPIFEEIVFRGIIQKGLINKGVNPNKAIWISAISFGLIHANPWQLVGAVLLGYILGLVYYKTKSLLLPILLHFFNNLVASISMEFMHSESFAELFNVSEYFVLGIGIITFIIFYVLFMKKYKTVN